MDYVVCIPSYKRAVICSEKTLAMLQYERIPPSRIYIYVANRQEYEEYKEQLNASTYNKLIIGKKGLVEQRQFIMNSWPVNKPIVFMDDDIKRVDLSISDRFKSHTLDFFFKSAFRDCTNHKAFIWGVYAVYNPFFRKPAPELSTQLKFIVGAFYGILNRPMLKSIRLTLTPLYGGQKEDTERTIKYFIEDGIVLRYNKIGFETKYYGSQGGMGTFEERLKPGIDISKKLLAAYPKYGKLKIRKNGMHEIVLAQIPANINEPQIISKVGLLTCKEEKRLGKLKTRKMNRR